MTEEDLKAVCVEWYITHGDRSVGIDEMSSTILEKLFDLFDLEFINTLDKTIFSMSLIRYTLTPKALELIKT